MNTKPAELKVAQTDAPALTTPTPPWWQRRSSSCAGRSILLCRRRGITTITARFTPTPRIACSAPGAPNSARRPGNYPRGGRMLYCYRKATCPPTPPFPNLEEDRTMWYVYVKVWDDWGLVHDAD